MPHVEFACEGKVLFRASAPEDVATVPRLHEIVVIDDLPYQVIDVEHWARRQGATDARALWPVVHLLPIPQDDWQRRTERRHPPAGPPRRY